MELKHANGGKRAFIVFGTLEDLEERIVDRRIHEIVKFSDNLCDFVSSCGIIDALHAARLLLEKHHEKQKPVHIAFLDLEKAFDRVSCELICWRFTETSERVQWESEELQALSGSDMLSALKIQGKVASST
ncbi:unnamed protein product [Heligmosomoides polygyrus]|uniref:Reverse transcriptase domain-containing protein n=1 Tax=Heligmosomoides polygyrus TaxID=6339 RepID=A0A3P8ATL5_HELPZ|nr:unnamed protein product [Heligmosomoides polygyrus]